MCLTHVCLSLRTFFLERFLHQWKGTLQTEVRADFLNARVAAWEPFVEPFIPVLSLVRGSSLELQRQADEEEYDTMMEAEEAQGLSRQHSGRGGLVRILLPLLRPLSWLSFSFFFCLTC